MRFILVFCFSISSVSLISAQTSSEFYLTVGVLSYNVLHGASTDGSFDLDVKADVIIKANPYFVELQEVDCKTNRAHKYDLITELGYRTRTSLLFGRAMHYDGGEYGERLLSKFSFLGTRNVPLPFTPCNEPRAALAGTVELPSEDRIVIVGTHLDHLGDPTDRIKQAETINSTWDRSQYPTILAGGLNALPGSQPINILESIWTPSDDRNKPSSTHPSTGASIKIDYVMYYPYLR